MEAAAKHPCQALLHVPVRCSSAQCMLEPSLPADKILAQRSELSFLCTH